MISKDIIRMAREAGFEVNFDIWAVSVDGIHINKHLERFAALFAAAERDSILKMSAENWYKTQADYDAAIRARGE